MEEQTELGPSGNRGFARQLTRPWEGTRLSCPPLPEASPALPLLSCGRSVAGTTNSSRLYFEITVPPAQRRRGRVLSPQSPASAPALLRASCPHSPYRSPPASSSLLPRRCPPPASLFFCRTIRGLLLLSQLSHCRLTAATLGRGLPLPAPLGLCGHPLPTPLGALGKPVCSALGSPSFPHSCPGSVYHLQKGMTPPERLSAGHLRPSHRPGPLEGFVFP